MSRLVPHSCRHSASMPQTLRYSGLQDTGPNMRICGRHIVLLTLATLALAACGGGESAGAGGGNLPPVIQGTPATTLTAGTPYSFTPQAADPNGDAITFSATNVPAW